MTNDTRRPPTGHRPSPANGKPVFLRGKSDFSKTGAPQRPAKPPRREASFVSQSARRVALDVLLDVSLQDAYASLALSRRLEGPIFLSDRDKRLVTELVYGTLENRIRLDYMIDCYLERKELDPVVRDILRMTDYQLFFLDRVPDTAAVDEAVKLARARAGESFTGLVNAVLRTMLREKERVVYPKPDEQPALYLSVMFSLPVFLAQRFIDAYGPKTALAIARHRDDEHAMTLRPNLERTTPEAFERFLRTNGISFEKGLLPGVYRVVQPGDMTSRPEYKRGLFSIQSESSLLAASALGAKPGQSLLDACAAPGGKTAVLSEAMHGTGRVYAWDLHEHRVALIRAMAQRLRLDNVRAAQRDAAVLKEDFIGVMDGVLLDAPCSGTGVMLQKPDIKYRQTEESIRALVATQSALLETCCKYVRPGGTLVYSTCSILPEENMLQVRAFLKHHPEFRMEPLGACLPEPLRALEQEGAVQLLAHRDGMDGFFIAKMRRAEG